MQGKWKVFVYAGFFLALAVIFQGIRFVFPMIPGPVNIFLIGSLVNMCLMLAVWTTESYWAAIIGMFLPVIAFFQGMLPVVLMIPVVGFGNALYAILGKRMQRNRLLWCVPFVKAAVLYIGTCAVTLLLVLPERIAAMLSFLMSWPQIITGFAGIVLARTILRRIKKAN